MLESGLRVFSCSSSRGLANRGLQLLGWREVSDQLAGHLQKVGVRRQIGGMRRWRQPRIPGLLLPTPRSLPCDAGMFLRNPLMKTWELEELRVPKAVLVR